MELPFWSLVQEMKNPPIRDKINIEKWTYLKYRTGKLYKYITPTVSLYWDQRDYKKMEFYFTGKLKSIVSFFPFFVFVLMDFFSSSSNLINLKADSGCCKGEGTKFLKCDIYINAYIYWFSVAAQQIKACQQ